jgi:hypothetical protein
VGCGRGRGCGDDDHDDDDNEDEDDEIDSHIRHQVTRGVPAEFTGDGSEAVEALHAQLAAARQEVSLGTLLRLLSLILTTNLYITE